MTIQFCTCKKPLTSTPLCITRPPRTNLAHYATHTACSFGIIRVVQRSAYVLVSKDALLSRGKKLLLVTTFSIELLQYSKYGLFQRKQG